jgi:hypothetical protein
MVRLPRTQELLKESAEEYFVGPVVRYSPNGISFNTAAALQDIYGLKSNCAKGKFYTFFPHQEKEPKVYNVHSEVNKELHSQRRSILSHAFSDKALRSMEGYMLDNIRILTRILGSDPQPHNMAQRFDHLTFDVLGDLCFGQSFEMQKNTKNRFINQCTLMSAKKPVLVSHLCA